MVKIKQIFTLTYGANLEFYKMIMDENGIPFVARTSKNNGVVGRVKIIRGIDPNPANTISVACSGSVLASFYQEKPYYSGRDIYYLSSRIDLTKNQILYYCIAIRANAYRYSYGRQANRTLAEILIPSPEEMPKWVSKKYLLQKIYLSNN